MSKRRTIGSVLKSSRRLLPMPPQPAMAAVSALALSAGLGCGPTRPQTYPPQVPQPYQNPDATFATPPQQQTDTEPPQRATPPQVYIPPDNTRPPQVAPQVAPPPPPQISPQAPQIAPPPPPQISPTPKANEGFAKDVPVRIKTRSPQPPQRKIKVKIRPPQPPQAPQALLAPPEPPQIAPPPPPQIPRLPPQAAPPHKPGDDQPSPVQQSQFDSKPVRVTAEPVDNSQAQPILVGPFDRLP